MIRIVSDTNCSLPQEVVDEYDITLVPLYALFGHEVFRDRYDITNEEFYRRMVTAKRLPTTSQPSVGDFEKVYREVLAENPGATILSIHLSAELSGTLDSARQAAALLPDTDIRTFDTRTVSLAQGFFVREAARMAREGASADEIMKHLEGMLERVEIYFVLDTLDYLAKGGRIGRAAHMVGTLLDLKPILTIRDGVIEAYSRQRTHRRAITALRELALKGVAGHERVHLGVVHAVAPKTAQTLADELCEKIQPEVFMMSEIGPGLGVHAGPGAVGVMWYLPA